LPIVLEDVALIGGLGLSPLLLLLLEARAWCRSAEYMNSDDGGWAVVPVAAGGYCWCRKSRKCENEVYPSSGFCIIMLCVSLSMQVVRIWSRTNKWITSLTVLNFGMFFRYELYRNLDYRETNLQSSSDEILKDDRLQSRQCYVSNVHWFFLLQFSLCNLIC
jgi:hypothetical protein